MEDEVERVASAVPVPTPVIAIEADFAQFAVETDPSATDKDKQKMTH